jgi:putative FmdB family regulatory protein
MPIYEFVCQGCGNEFERLQSFSDASTPLCPNCQSVQVRRRLSPPAIHFKGSGWYVTDSKNGAKNGKSTAGAATKESETTGAPATEKDATKEPIKSESTKGEGAKSEGAPSAVKESV